MSTSPVGLCLVCKDVELIRPNEGRPSDGAATPAWLAPGLRRDEIERYLAARPKVRHRSGMHGVIKSSAAGEGDAVTGLPAHIKHAIRQKRDGRELVLVMSSRPRFELGRLDLDCTTLDLADLDRSYYLRAAAKTARALARFIDEGGFERVCFVGGSKAGFGALMLSRELADALPLVQFAAITFSPQTRLWPKNESLEFPSYVDLLADAKHDRRLAAALEKFGDQRRPLNASNLQWRVFYGAKNAGDTAEASSLVAGAATIVPFPMRSHCTLLPILCAGMGVEQVRQLVQTRYGAKHDDADIAFDLLTSEQEDLVTEIFATLPQPTFKELIRDSLNALPGRSVWRQLMSRIGRA